jgi:hypothetical protein
VREARNVARMENMTNGYGVFVENVEKKVILKWVLKDVRWVFNELIGSGQKPLTGPCNAIMNRRVL